MSGQQEVEAPDRCIIDVAGDVLPESSWLGPQDAPHIFDGVREEFALADLVFVNLEEPVTDAGTVTPYKNRAEVRAGRDYILRARNAAIPEIFKAAGVGLVGLANNHMMDYTGAGLRDTLRVFHQAELPVVGAGLKPEAERAYIFAACGIRVALLAFTDIVPPNYQATEFRLGVAATKYEGDLIDAIKRARQHADFVIVMMHWGGQGGHLITPRQRQLARLMAKSGCAAVIGMHPHVLQGVEYMGTMPVFYSIGNFAFPSSRQVARESIIVRLTIGLQGLEKVEIVPAEISREGAPSIATGTMGQEILSHLDGFCRMFNSRIDQNKLAPGPVRDKLIYDNSGGHIRRRSSAASRHHTHAQVLRRAGSVSCS